MSISIQQKMSFKKSLFCFWHDFKKNVFFSIELILFEKKIINGNKNIFCSKQIFVLPYNQGFNI